MKNAQTTAAATPELFEAEIAVMAVFEAHSVNGVLYREALTVWETATARGMARKGLLVMSEKDGRIDSFRKPEPTAPEPAPAPAVGFTIDVTQTFKNLVSLHVATAKDSAGNVIATYKSRYISVARHGAAKKARKALRSAPAVTLLTEFEREVYEDVVSKGGEGIAAHVMGGDTLKAVRRLHKQGCVAKGTLNTGGPFYYAAEWNNAPAVAECPAEARPDVAAITARAAVALRGFGVALRAARNYKAAAYNFRQADRNYLVQELELPEGTAIAGLPGTNYAGQLFTKGGHIGPAGHVWVSPCGACFSATDTRIWASEKWHVTLPSAVTA